MIKKLIKSLLPNVVREKINERSMNQYRASFYQDDMKRLCEYSGVLQSNDTSTKLVANIALNCHVVEKGLTMPQMRLGFGYKVITDLVLLCSTYLDRGYKMHEQVIHAVECLNEYKATQIKHDFIVDSEILKSIDDLVLRTNILQESKQLHFTSEEYFSNVGASFDLFSASRHSLRNYEGTLCTEAIVEAVKLAINAPSSCNRQPSRVYIIEDKAKIAEVLSFQNGHRGFGHLADKLIVLTAEVGVYNTINERNSPYIDGGMFGMNLLYALHYHKIGACTLNCYFDADRDKKMRAALGVPDSEVFIFILTLGIAPAEFDIAISKRNEPNETIKIV